MASILGKQADRIKTDVRMPPELSGQMDAVARSLGVPRNVVWVIAATTWLADMGRVVKDQSSVELLEVTRGLYEKVYGRAKNFLTGTLT